MNNNFTLNFDNAAISKEELIALLASKGVEIKKTQPKVTDKLSYDENKVAHCIYCHEEVDIDSLTEEEQLKAKKSGLCPKCQAKLEELSKMKDLLKGTRTVRPAGVEGVATKIKNLFTSIQDQLTEEHIALLTDKEFSRVNISLSYAFLLDITDMTTEEIKVATKDAKDRTRYAAPIYTINNRKYRMTNDLYEAKKNFEKFEKVIANFGLID